MATEKATARRRRLLPSAHHRRTCLNLNAKGTSAEEPILDYARAEAPQPRALGEIASAAGLDPITCGRALIALYDRGLLSVTWLGDDRWVLNPTPSARLDQRTERACLTQQPEDSADGSR